jgi:Tol biopolymer transport system component/DNA-binding winged helix-turn-helix (wHTH) protein
MSASVNAIYEFGPYRLSPGERQLTCRGAAIPLTPKAFDTLHLLVRSAGHLVAKESLMQEVWPDAFVEESSLTRNISVLRRLLAEGAGGQEFIETVPRAGYRFIAPVSELEDDGALVIEHHRRARIVTEEVEDTFPAASERPLLVGPRRRLALVAVGVVALATAAVAWRTLQGGAPFATFSASGASSSAVAMASLRPVPFTSYPGWVHLPSFSPDGQRLAFPWTGPAGENLDLYVKARGNDPPIQITDGLASDAFPAWSPDGNQIAFIREMDGHVGIYVVGSLGGAVRKLLDLTYSRYFDLDWSPDGRYIAFAEKTNPRERYDSHRSFAVFLLNVDTLERRQLTFPRDPDRDHRFAFSPDGRTLAFMRYDDHRTAICVIPVEGGSPTRVYEETNWMGHLSWMANGQALVFSSDREGGSKLFRISGAGGQPEPLSFAGDAVYFPAVAPRGDRMAYVREETDADLWQVQMDSSSPAANPKPRALLASPRSESAPEFSPDGSRIAFFSAGTGPNELWVSEANGNRPTPLTDFQAASGHAPSWSPDGRELAFESTRGPGGSPGGVFVLNVNTRELRRLTDQPGVWPWWSSDGQWIYVASASWRGRTGIWKVPVSGGEPVQVSAVPALRGEESFDGRSLYFSKLEGGIWKMPVQGGEASLVVPNFHWDFGKDVRGYWRVAQNGIFYLNVNAPGGPAVEFLDFASGRSRRLVRLADRYHKDLFPGGLTVSPEGRSIVYSVGSRAATNIMLVENFR